MGRIKGYDILMVIVISIIWGHAQAVGDSFTMKFACLGILVFVAKLVAYGWAKNKRGSVKNG